MAKPLVLLVDDSEETRAMYADYLVHFGVRVEHAVDGDHALWKVVSLKPNVVVMDLAMPVLDGWEATHRMKTHPKTKHIPVIALTGHVTRRELRRAQDAARTSCSAKPCLPEALLAAVRRLLTATP